MKIVLNEDHEVVALIRKGLKERNGFCPCRVEDIPDNKCICKEFREQGLGLCHCGLYNKIEI